MERFQLVERLNSKRCFFTLGRLNRGHQWLHVLLNRIFKPDGVFVLFVNPSVWSKLIKSLKCNSCCLWTRQSVFLIIFRINFFDRQSLYNFQNTSSCISMHLARMVKLRCIFHWSVKIWFKLSELGMCKQERLGHIQLFFVSVSTTAEINPRNRR